jgi:hypothetical protein
MTVVRINKETINSSIIYPKLDKTNLYYLEKIYFTRITPIGLLKNKVLNNNFR